MEPTKEISQPPKVNRQLYANSGLRELFVDSPAPDPSAGFFNQSEPNLAILHEKPQHRLLLLLKMSGRTNREISKESGYTEPWLSQLFRQPWATALMARLSAEAGIDGIRGLLQSECIPSITTLAQLRDDVDCPKAVRKSACDSLIQQFLGKPAQHVDIVEDRRGLDAGSVAEMDQEIARLRQEEKDLLGHN